ncbi:O-methyltransferase [Halosimplex sp. J119]
MRSILTDETAEYVREMQPDVDDHLETMEAYARENRVPIASRDVAQFQTMLVEATGADRALEIGTAIGYTTVQIARAGADVVSLERDPDRIEVAEQFVAEAGVEGSVSIERGDATDLLPELDGEFDLAFIDAKKDEYETYLEHVVPLLRPNGVLVVDNLFRGGRVPEAAVTDEQPDTRVEAILEFNDRFLDHPQLESVLLPLADGTGFAVKSE